MKIVLQLAKEFWLPLLASIIWTVTNYYSAKTEVWTWTKFVNVAAPTFFFASWMTSQYYRVKKQEHVASTLTTIESRVLGVMDKVEQQSQEMKYLSEAQLIQTFDEVIDSFRETKEELADLSRLAKRGDPIDARVFLLYRENPFYQPRRQLAQLVSYSMHTAKIGKHHKLESRYSSAAHHIEELAGHIGVFLGRLNQGEVEWNTHWSRSLVLEICSKIELSKENLVTHSKYKQNVPYKGGADFDTVLTGLVAKLRRLAEEINDEGER